MKPIIRYLVTGAIVLVAIAVGVHRWRVFFENPWTRDGMVQANVIQIVPRVSGPVVTLPIRDNQFVHAGDLLLEIDPRAYPASLDQARAQLDQTGGNIQASVKQVESARAGIDVARGSISQAEDMKAQLTAVIARNKAELERQQDMLPKKATSQKAVERAQAMYDVSLEEKKTAEAAIGPGRGETAPVPGGAGRGAGQARRPGRCESAAPARTRRRQASRAEPRVHQNATRRPTGTSPICACGLAVMSWPISRRWRSSTRPATGWTATSRRTRSGASRRATARWSRSCPTRIDRWRASWTASAGASRSRTAAPESISCRRSARHSSGSGWRSGFPCACT